MKEDPSPIPKDCEAFTLGEQIGNGSFATVYKALDKKTNSTIAIKAFRMKHMDRNNFTRAATEISFIKLLQHPNIIPYVCSEINRVYMYLGIEYSPHGCLANYMKKNCPLPEKLVQIVMKQLLSAVCYLHDKYIFHGDIKPENIIITNEKDLIIKLTDFGLAEVIIKNQGCQKRSGSFFYMSPEIHLGFPTNYTSDLFSAGVVMYEMIYNDKPLPMQVTKEEYVTLLRKRIQIKFPESDLLTPSCLDLVQGLLRYDKEKRPAGRELLIHPFLTIQLVRDEQNHYFQAYASFVKSIELVQAKQYGGAYIEVTEAILHLRIHLSRVATPGLYRYVLMKIEEFSAYSRKILDRMLIDQTDSDPLEMHSESDRLRHMLQSSPDILAAYDLAAVGEMYFLENEVQRGREYIKNGLDILFNKISREPQGLRKQLLGTKMTQWMNLLEGSDAGARQGTSRQN